MRGKVQVIVGGQYGSEAKGAVAAHLAGEEDRLVAIRVAGPNAGHTVIGKDGQAFALRQIPVAAVTNPNAQLCIAAGSEIDPPVLADELSLLDEAGYDASGRLVIDWSATIIEDRHKDREFDLTQKIGSTGKGIGAARADRVMRQAELYGGDDDTAELARNALHRGETVQVEGTQGFGLGLHGKYYPKCTSSDCRAIDFLAMAGVNPWDARHTEVWVALRTFPIRVAGDSGPMKNETTWTKLGADTDGYVRPEYTTVTKRERRVAEWDLELALEALQANGAPSRNVQVALSFLDYEFPGLALATGNRLLTNTAAMRWVEHLEGHLDAPIRLVGTGPAHYTRRDV